MSTPQPRQRLDKWIWFARFARTRSAAQDLIEAGRVRIAGKRITASAHALKEGDVLTIAAPHETAVVRVIGLGERRGDAASVAALYEKIG
ncbi:MAG: RNA-binding S4 domain-containing protein [Beijerinckiaceae bacterium]|nr:RNA-binding S4 domain-containing protein [Beijerinckiaceae bacterium]